MDNLDQVKTITTLPSGYVLADRYRIIKTLGRGGMGIVYLAMDQKLDMNVAIKVIAPSLAQDERAVLNLKEEAKIGMRLVHLNIMRVYNFEDRQETKFLIMEYIDGSTLGEMLQKSEGRKLPVEQVIAYTRQICAGLQYAHAQSVWHRDIKPSNIMVISEGVAKITDFGIARVAKDSSSRLSGAQTPGTLLYMSPEQVLGENPDHRSDIYSLGAALYELLSGEPPFHSGAIEYQILNKLPAPIDGIPERMNKIILKALAKKKEQRWASAGELLEALEGKDRVRAAEKEEPVVEKPPVNRARNVWLIVSGLVLLAVMLGVWLARPRQEPPVPPPDNRTDSQEVKQSAEMVLVPAGSFFMGCNKGTDKECLPDEKPGRQVYLDAFHIDKYEVTNQQFRQFVDKTGYKTEAEKEGSGWIYKNNSWQKMAGANWRHPQGPNSDASDILNHPVVQISWNDAKAYCEWAGERLPTEAEWEKAARGTDGRKYPWGNSPPDGSKLNYCDKHCGQPWRDKKVDDGYESTAPVGNYPTGASPYGAMDMAGNVWEWVADWYDEQYFRNPPERNPTGPSRGTSRICRGGALDNPGQYVRASVRFKLDPSIRNTVVGVRCAKTP